ncbi:hypothetical protein K227x_37240 [Rubripirellula lacrimiformis]|uniref:Uncharacterized protein n=1 Tax=Rubripirellula lacrimiformis TaxID=1930273 RepID=A0A517NDW6_9BACT|nr:hypothetical protein [Rubripirellula lacrimiformis]QDT05324.1 hypothetical protein K227x_37240 [Rubripirellula lacrimiformis]
MKTFYVATLARYVLVDAADEAEAASLGQDSLHALYADLRAKHGRDCHGALEKGPPVGN